MTISKYQIEEIEGYIKYYEELGWTPKIKDYVEMWNAYYVALQAAYEKFDEIVNSFIKIDSFRRFLLLHSIFDMHDDVSSDEFTRMMAWKLAPTKVDLAIVGGKPFTRPEAIKLVDFDVEMIHPHMFLYPYEIRYSMYQQRRPVELRDLGFDERKDKTATDMAAYLASFQPIICVEAAEKRKFIDHIDDDDLPF